MTNSHTKPWLIRRNPTTNLLFVGPYPIAKVHEEGRFEADDEIYEDARLIAIAPEMFNVLQTISELSIGQGILAISLACKVLGKESPDFDSLAAT